MTKAGLDLCRNSDGRKEEMTDSYKELVGRKPLGGGTTVSSSSAKMVPSKTPEATLELGIHLVRELDRQDSTHTMERWMAHHLAELINDSRNAATPKARRIARDRATRLILELWDRRSTLHGNIDPLAAYKSALPALELLTTNSTVWSGKKKSEDQELAIKLFQHVRQIVVLLLGNVLPPLPKPPLPSIVITFLSQVEKRVLGDLDTVFAGTQKGDLVAEIGNAQKLLKELSKVVSEQQSMQGTVVENPKE